MAEDKLDFLDENPKEQKATEPEPKAEPVVVADEAKAAEENVPAEPAVDPEGKGEPVAAPPAAEPEAKSIPVTALLDEREKRQAAQRQAEESQRKLKELEAQLRDLQTPKETPDFYTDPDAAFNAREAKIEQKMISDKLRTSKFFAEREFGAELVAEAYAYFDQHPQESQLLLEHPSPFHAAVEHYKRQKFLTEVQDPEAWKAQQLEALRKQLAEEAAAAVQPKPKLPPASLSTATSAGGEPKTPGTAFDGVFGT